MKNFSNTALRLLIELECRISRLVDSSSAFEEVSCDGMNVKTRGILLMFQVEPSHLSLCS